jgi:hypothetical protein
MLKAATFCVFFGLDLVVSFHSPTLRTRLEEFLPAWASPAFVQIKIL